MKKSLAFLTVSCMLILASCGSSKKLESAQKENNQLKAQNAQLSSNVNDLQKQVNDLTSSNKAATDNFNTYKTSCEASQAKLQAIQKWVNDQYAILQQVEKKLEAAEANFNSKGVNVYYKDGMVYVSMQNALLFKSGSAQLDPKAKAALAPVGSVLNDYPKLQVIVVGNSDSVASKKGSDNWSISTERANNVVRTLRDDYKVDPSRLVSAGKGHYNPVADNTTEQGRAANRRTDIILNPDLMKLWQSAQAELKQ
jgi:chemotaxis protein MotB